MALLRVLLEGVVGLVIGVLATHAVRPLQVTRSWRRVERCVVILGPAALFAVSGALLPPTPVATLVAVFLTTLLLCSLIDVKARIIPNRVLYPSFVLSLMCIAALAAGRHWVSPRDAALGLVTYGGGLLVVALLAPPALGMGDVKLAGLIGLVVGAVDLPHVIVAALLGIVAGGVGATASLVVGRRAAETMPFAPYLAIGGAAAVWSAVLARSPS